ncbi:hypothetical protein IE81DRAFT_171480 [Ceraceosorus guamensis]|uniref:Seipin n=1 Tax=Ceraceosorus guamensis TaxID=1522189 RepID=A0A316VVR5_9BASI|nr:hypothetical protein IE81DRAFT_171480 [Ceraceosorus guamensis]PWN41549.1 hypothetical protein IE81DRAFT_171480 [Ceraceosorus guamensis]
MAPPSYGGSASGSSSRVSSSMPSRHHRVQPAPRIPPPPLIPPTITDALSQLPPPSLWPGLALQYLVIDPLLALLDNITALILSPKTHRLVLRLSVLGGIWTTAVALAIAGYVGFYRAWVPHIGHSYDVWLQYGKEAIPSADIDLARIMRGQSFARDQEYDVSVDLAVPLSAANLDLGNFMVSIDLFSADDAQAYSIARPALITYNPAPMRVLQNVAHSLTRQSSLSLPLSTNPTALFTVPLLRRAILSPASSSHPFTPSPAQVVKAKVKIGREDADKYWRYGGGHGVGGLRTDIGPGRVLGVTEGFRSRGELQTSAVSLRIDAHLTGLRWFMYHRPVLSFVLFTSLFLAFELVSALTLWALAALYTSNLVAMPNLAVEENYVDHQRRRRRRGGNSSSAEDTANGNGATTAGTTDGLTPGGVYDESTSPLDDDAGSGGETETEARNRARNLLQAREQRSRASLRALDEREAAESRRAEAMRDFAEGRRMTGVPSLTHEEERLQAEREQQALLTERELELEMGSRRVLGRLDEETEEETDVGGSEGYGQGREGEQDEQSGSGNAWEEIDAEEESEEMNAEQQRREGLRRRAAKSSEEQGRESTVSGVSSAAGTMRANS